MFTGQGQITDDDADPFTIELINPAVTERLMTSAQQQAIHRIETAQEIGINVESGN